MNNCECEFMLPIKKINNLYDFITVLLLQCLKNKMHYKLSYNLFIDVVFGLFVYGY